MEKPPSASAAGAVSAVVPTRVLLLLFFVVLAVHLILLSQQNVGRSAVEVKINRPFVVTQVARNQSGESPSINSAAPTQPVAPARARSINPRQADSKAVLASVPNPDASMPEIAPPSPVADADAQAIAHPEPHVQAQTQQAQTQSTPLARASAVLIPGSLRLRYNILGEVRRMSYSARAELLWLQDGQTYDARLEVGAFLLGSRVQTSSGRITEQGLAPKRFSDKARSEVAAHFERDKGKVIFSANTPPADLQADAQDQLSIFVQLASLIAGEPGRYPRGTAVEMQAVGAREADTWRFVVDGEESISVPAGDLTTLKITRLPRQQYDLTVELWLAPTLGYLPARIRLTQSNGDFIDQQLRNSETPK